MTKVIFYGVIRVKDHVNYSFESLVEQKRAEGFDPVCFCCENRFEWGKSLFGLEVMNLADALTRYENTPILVTCLCTYDLFKTMRDLPIKYNFSPDKIINFDECYFMKTFDFDVCLGEYDKAKPIIFYGCGGLVGEFLYELRKQSVNPAFICDTNESKHGQYVGGVYVCSLKEARRRLASDFYIIISSIHYTQIRDYLVTELKVDPGVILNVWNYERTWISDNLFTVAGKY